jgi:hypothetical protein
MSELKKIARDAPPVQTNLIEPTLVYLERYVRKPLEGSWFDVWIATPMKEYYIMAKRKD